MTNPTLAEVAAYVAAALNMTIFYDEQMVLDHYQMEIGAPILMADGSNITNPYWRCACEDWLLARGALTLASVPFGLLPDRHGCLLNDGGDVWIEFCPWPEAAARLVSAVWSRMQQEK